MSETQDPSLGHAESLNAYFLASAQSELLGTGSTHYELSAESQQAADSIRECLSEKPHELVSAALIEECTAALIPPILALDMKEYPLNALSHRLNGWLASKNLPKSTARSFLSVLQERLKRVHEITVYKPSDRTLSADDEAERKRRLPIGSIEPAIDAIGFSASDRKHVVRVLTRVLSTLSVANQKASYRGIGVVLGRVLQKNLPPTDARLRGDALRDAIVHIIEFLCAQENVSVLGDGDVVYPPVTELRIDLPPQSDGESDAYVSGDDEPDADFGDVISDEYEDVDFEELGIHPENPTEAKPGSEEKVVMLAARYAAGLPLWNPGDCTDHGPTRHLRGDGNAGDGTFEQRERRRADENYAQELEDAKRRSASKRDAAKSNASSDTIDAPLEILPEETADEDDDD